MTEPTPRAWMRRWAFDGEKPPPPVVMGRRIRMPAKFRLMPVTLNKALPDDVPLYAATDGVVASDGEGVCPQDADAPPRNEQGGGI